jgi:hypothetical protein
MKVARNSVSKVEFEKEEMSKEPKVIADETMVVVLVVGAAVVGEAVGAAVVGETVGEPVVGAQV